MTPTSRAASTALVAVAMTLVAGLGALTVRDRSAATVAETSAVFYGAVSTVD
ncbi:MAG: hypothetical protein LWW93_06780 [Hyphomicrobiales bacterium]|nr:hypothetical protein [Hyphomicrobiales bacterium]